MKRVALALLALCCAVAPVGAATTYYFSDCATGGTGAIDDPFCIDPPGGGTNEFIMALFDGNGTQAVAGDTINICCGGTGGCTDAPSSCTIAPTPTSGSTFRPTVNADGNPITIQSYGGDVPIVTGDLNGNAVCDGGDATNLISLAVGTLHGYHFVGPMVWKRGCSNAFSATVDNADILFDGVTLQEAGSGAWGHTADGIGADKTLVLIDGALHTHCFADAAPGFLIYDDSSTGNFTFRNGNLNAACGMAIRHILGTGGTWLIENNIGYNGAQLTNDWGNWNWHTNSGQIPIYRSNNFYDFQNGISIEDRNRYFVVEDNEIWCKGQYDVGADGFPRDCAAQGPAISITGGDDPYGCPQHNRNGTNADYTIRRNRLHGSLWSGAPSSQSGWMAGGIGIQDGCRDINACTGPGQPFFCCTDFHAWTCNQGSTEVVNNGCSVVYGCLTSDAHTNLVENNMIWNTWNNVGINERAASHSAIWVDSNTPVTVQNNTLKRNRFALDVRGGVSQAPVAHVLRNNLVTDSPNVECLIASSVAPVFENNDCHDPLAGSAVVVTAGTTNYTCDLANTYGTLTRCTGPNFVDTGSLDPTRWNLRLRYPSVGVINSGSSSGASIDIDGTTRPLNASWDIGADECPYSAIDESAQPEPGPVAPIILGGKVTVP